MADNKSNENVFKKIDSKKDKDFKKKKRAAKKKPVSKAGVWAQRVFFTVVTIALIVFGVIAYRFIWSGYTADTSSPRDKVSIDLTQEEIDTLEARLIENEYCDKITVTQVGTIIYFDIIIRPDIPIEHVPGTGFDQIPTMVAELNPEYQTMFDIQVVVTNESPDTGYHTAGSFNVISQKFVWASYGQCEECVPVPVEPNTTEPGEESTGTEPAPAG